MHVVVGATGTVGRTAVRLLLEAGQEVAAVTRNPEAEIPDGARTVVADPSRPATLADALHGAETVLLSPRAVGDAAAELLSLAGGFGARHVVVLSAATADHPVGDPRFIRHFEAVEAAARESSLSYTYLRCADFAANSAAWAPQIRSGDVVRGAYAKASTSPIHERDIAEIAVEALLKDAHSGRAYVLTGPESLAQHDKVRIIGETLGRALSFVELPAEAVRSAMLTQGLPDEIPDRLLGSLADYAQHPGPTTDTVERLLGRPARSFRAWAEENTHLFSADGPS
ncbi:NAD(P)H-binding protein [Streptodolium elevatio]